MDQSPSAVDLMTMTAFEVAVERVLTFHKSVRMMSNGKRRWISAGMTKVVAFLIHRSVADSTYVTRAEQSKDGIPSPSRQECVGRCVHLQQSC